MPKDVPIKPGQTFHLPAAQQKNLSTLLGVLKKREATEAIKAMGEMDRGMWSDARDTMGSIRAIVESGGLGAITESFTETIKLQIEDMLSPLTNEINQLIGEVMAPIKVLLNDIINELSQFVAANSVGGAIGGISGQVLAYFLPGGQIWVILGALIGSLIESLLSPTEVSEAVAIDIMAQLGLDVTSEEMQDFRERQAFFIELLGPGTHTLAEVLAALEASQTDEYS